MRARSGGGAAARVAGVLAAPGPQGSGQLGQQDLQCSRRVWQPVMANTLQNSCLEHAPVREAWQDTVYRVTPRVGHDRSDSVRIDARFCFACGSSAPERVECTAAWLAGTLVVQSVQGHGLPLPQELGHYQSLLLSLL